MTASIDGGGLWHVLGVLGGGAWVRSLCFGTPSLFVRMAKWHLGVAAAVRGVRHGHVVRHQAGAGREAAHDHASRASRRPARTRHVARWL